MLYLGKLTEIYYVPNSYEKPGKSDCRWIKVEVEDVEYQVFKNCKIGDIIEDDTDYSYGEYAYEKRKWEIIQKIIPIK